MWTRNKSIVEGGGWRDQQVQHFDDVFQSSSFWLLPTQPNHDQQVQHFDDVFQSSSFWLLPTQPNHDVKSRQKDFLEIFTLTLSYQFKGYVDEDQINWRGGGWRDQQVQHFDDDFQSSSFWLLATQPNHHVKSSQDFLGMNEWRILMTSSWLGNLDHSVFQFEAVA
ncbi:hypothetical protein QE152_g27303 [Popillia japonica]|uniref:Uncharacterized protein n=1 Tax=Popillia japonica TaxID=7064 RepID=A0AAW1JWT3_POPJA